MGSLATNPTSDFNTSSITLVTPIKIFSNLQSPGEVEFGVGVASISIHLVPEPGTLVLLGAGVAGFALWGRRRMKR
jgi:hypothetical protein